MDDIEVEVEADVNPTEDEAKVLTALRNLFPQITFRVMTEGRSGVARGYAKGSEALKNLRRLIEQARIRSAARAKLMAGISTRETRAFFNKQAAFAGKVSFAEEFGESPLGPIRLLVRASAPEEVVDWLTSHRATGRNRR